MAGAIYDLAIIGGGVNGAGIARDAATRGLRVILFEAADLGGATSSASSKLIHGGLRYLEHYEFRLVREALAEREVLLSIAPHIVRPLRFVLPYVDNMRPLWMLRSGLFLYDHLATRTSLGRSCLINFAHDPTGTPLRPELQKGFTYWDCAVDDARLVVLNAMAAREAGATILTNAPVTRLFKRDGVWNVQAKGQTLAFAHVVVNAAGPWVEEVAQLSNPTSNKPAARIRLVRGSHIVVPRISSSGDAYTFQNSDGRVVFALPFEGAFTLIGTTELAEPTVRRDVEPDTSEVAYLIDAANRFFRAQISRDDVVWSFSGLRPLDDDGSASPSAVSRDYRFILDAEEGAPPILHIIGGKITTYRKLAEAALDTLEPHLPLMRPGITGSVPLPGGDLSHRSFNDWFDETHAKRPAFSREQLLSLARRYGTRIDRLLGDAKSLDDLGTVVSAGLTARELHYLKREEWAETASDVLWRRTKSGVHIHPDKRLRAADEIQKYLDMVR